MLKRDREPGKILIIGSGVGGLTTGIICAKLGYPVTIVEKNNLPGGLMRGYRRQGYDCPVGVHYLGSLDVGQPLRRLWDYFGVTSLIPRERMGVGGVIDRYVFDDFAFDLPEGVSAFEDNLRRSFPAEQTPISAIMAHLKETCASLFQLETLLSSGGNFVSPESFTAMGEHLDRLGCSRRLKSVLGVPATLIGVPLQNCPLFFYYMILASYLLSSWRLTGSSSRMAEAFTDRFCLLGGELLTGNGVESIMTTGGVVQGVRLESGREVAADTVIAAIHPQKVVPMLPEGSFRADHVERISGLENTKGLFVVTLVIDGKTQEALPYNIYRLHAEEDGSLLHGSFHQICRTDQPGIHILTMMATSSIDEWQPWINTRSGHRGLDYEAAKGEKAVGLIAEAKTLFGSLPDAEIIDMYTPLTIRDWVASPGGSAYGIMRSSGQLMKTACLNRPSIAGLYFAGQNILAPGILGTSLGSFQVIKRVIGQERFRREVVELIH